MMLLLSRKVGQKIRISEDIVVVIRAIEGRRVKIGIEAPKETEVLRAEIALLSTASRSEAD